MQLQAAFLAGVMFNDPKAGHEMFQELLGALSDEGDTASDDAWLTNPDATTDVAALEQVIQRRIHERSQTNNG